MTLKMTLVSSYDMEVKAQVVSRHKHAMPKGKHDKTATAISDVESPASNSDQSARAVGPHNVSPRQSISTLSAKPAPLVQKLRRKVTSDVNDPDNAAIDMINVQRRSRFVCVLLTSLQNGVTWREAHEQWERATKRAVSPGGFGKHIQEVWRQAPTPSDTMAGPHPQSSQVVGAGNPAVAQNSHVASSGVQPSRMVERHSLQTSRKVSAPALRPGPQVPPHHQGSRPSSAHDLTALPASTHPSQRSLSHTQLPPSALPPQAHVAHHTADDNLVLNDFHHTMSAKVAVLEQNMAEMYSFMQELDRQNAALLKQNEELRSRPATGLPGMPNLDVLHALSESVMTASTKAAAVDTLKIQVDLLVRRVQLLESQGTSVVQSTHSPLEHHVSVGRENEAKSECAGHGSAKRTSGATFLIDNGSEYKRARTNSFDSNHPVGPHSLTPLAATPVDSFHASPSGSTRGMRKGPGRPRKAHSSPFTHATGPSMQFSAVNSQVITDGYYATDEAATARDSELPDRGRVIRRGMGGTTGHSVVDGTSTGEGKRTRQKPIRNEQGILVRKDGKPDMRSVSSAQNLKRVHDKKTLERREEVANGSAGRSGPSSATVNVSVTISDDEEEEGNSSTLERFKKPEPKDHAQVMKEMFPRGVSQTMVNTDLASRVFAVLPNPESVLQPREAAVESSKAEAPAEAETTPRDSEARGRRSV